MKAILVLLKRSLFPTGGHILSFALWISVVGVALGIVQLIVVLAVMSGFQQFLQKTYTKISSEMVVIPKARAQMTSRDLLEVEGVRAVSPFQLGQAMLTKEGAVGVVLEGIEESTSESVTPWREVWVDPPNLFPDPGKDWIWLGAQLAKKLGAVKGDTVNLFIPGQNKIYPFRVTAITKFGIYDHDLRYARLPLTYLNELMGAELEAPMYKVNAAESFSIAETQWNIIQKLGEKVRVRLWSDVNQNLFKAVEHQKLSLFAILEIVIALAAMNVVNLLMMSADHRKRDIAILRAMGLRRGSLFGFFVIQGLAVGTVGILGGIGFGLVACELIKVLQPSFLSESVYNVTRLPIRIIWSDVGLIAGCALLICLLFSIIPAIRAARQPPLDALRYE